jgi:hypothetical protein
MHVHVQSANGEAKVWLEPKIELAENRGLRSLEIATARRLIYEDENKIRRGWKNHFRR